uniref:SOWAHA-C winged helix-turn-helix domain-containing protein n=1 Tax=Anabas testudineus TaxID=64144 RepID=A0A7N6FCF8_ANATE
MATELSQDAVLSFLRVHGGSVRNSDMLLHFRGFIREHADRDRNRELFKKFVNSVATVRNDDGVSHIVLRKQFRGTVPGPGSSGPPRAPDGKISELIPAESAGKSRAQPRPENQDVPWRRSGGRKRDNLLPFVVLSSSYDAIHIIYHQHININNTDICSCQSLVPLEPREHTWFVKGAAGAWPDIYCLFRDDSSLLNKQDFISGFTVLHWIAKHGDHRVLNTLCPHLKFEKAGLTLNVNARAKCGHTPLHIAAMHGKNNMMRLLVKKFNADVRQRDIAGKKPWQYLSYTTPPDIFQLLGAPARAALGGVGRLDQLQQPPPQQRQHRSRRHHLSSTKPQLIFVNVDFIYSSYCFLIIHPDLASRQPFHFSSFL